MSKRFRYGLAIVWLVATLLLTAVQVVPLLAAGQIGTQFGINLGALGIVGIVLMSIFSLIVSAFVVTIFMVVIGSFLGFGLLAFRRR